MVENKKVSPTDKPLLVLTGKRALLASMCASTVAALVLPKLIENKKIKKPIDEKTLEDEITRLKGIVKAHISPRIEDLGDAQVEETLQEEHPRGISRKERIIQFAKSLIIKKHV